ncbi:MAG: hypothetical protein WAQ28_12980 [Bacteroidia bacterium]
MNQKKLIINLIKDNLINTRLVKGLNDLGFNAGQFDLHLGETILELMNIKIGDEQFDGYIELFERSHEVDIIQKPELIKNIAEKIYRHLVKIKSNSQ